MARSAFLLALAAVVCMAIGGASAAPERFVPPPTCTAGKCLACISPWKCLRCRDGYYRDTKMQCRRCPSTCKTCAAFPGTNRPWCISCKLPFIRKKGACVMPPIVAACPAPKWDAATQSWTGVVGRNDAGACIKCKPTGDFAGWCKACDGDSPSICTKCSNPSKPLVRLEIDDGECQISDKIVNPGVIP